MDEGPCERIPFVYGGARFGLCSVGDMWRMSSEEPRIQGVVLGILMLPFAAFFIADLPFSAAADTILLPVTIPVQAKYGDRC